MNSTITRRSFIKQTGFGVAAASAAGVGISCEKPVKVVVEEMPRRILGKTGLEISQLSFGGGSQFLKNKDGDWELILEQALNLGINVFDTASSYQWGASMSSEQRFGKILSLHRDKIFISTKFDSRKPDEAMKEIEKSLTDMKTDYIDILLLHSVEKSEDLDDFADGIYPMMLKLKEEGVAKFIGFSSMNSAEKSRDLINRFDIDACILAMNPTKYGNFVEIALPAANAKNVGVFAMKVMRDIVGNKATAEELIAYALDKEGVASACIGHFGRNTLEENAAIIANRPDGKKVILYDGNELESRLAHISGPHALCWARPDYFDGKMC
jgi:uncharacterized protein